jgi:transcription elongation factor Elf1
MGARSTCPNCKKLITCGCQLKTASNNTKVCTNCIANYEAKIREWKLATIVTPVDQKK